MKKFGIISLIVLSVVIGGACTTSKQQRKSGANAAEEQRRVGDGFSRLANSQPVPTFDYSQERQTLIDVETIRATGTASTTAFYLENVGLVAWCPSIGAPVASTHQLSASKQWVDLPGDHTQDRVEVDQGEPTGIYVGQSTGTWTLCLDNNGKKFAIYWEGYVFSTVATLTYPADKRLQPTDITFNFKAAPGK